MPNWKELGFKYYPAWFDDARKIIEHPDHKRSVEAARYWLTHCKPISKDPARRF